MNFIYILLIFVQINAITSSPKNQNFTDEIVPDVIDVWPDEKIIVQYPNNKSVDFGNELTPLETKFEPSLQWKSEPNVYYTLIMVDPDAPLRDTPLVREVKHWLIVNILETNITSGETIAEYIGAGPPYQTGFHRYIFLIFQQPHKINFTEPYSSKLSSDHRLKFSTRNFADEYKLGDPFAVNYFKAQWELYVDFRNKQVQINI